MTLVPITGQQPLIDLGPYCPARDCYALCDPGSCRCRPCRCPRCRIRSAKAVRGWFRRRRKLRPVVSWAPQTRLFNPTRRYP